jgi:hypothetical protein
MYSNEYKVILGEQVLVWCVGSLIVKRAFLAARQAEGLNLGIQNTTVWWQGYSGLSILSVKSKLETLSKVSVDPNFIILHCGGNELGAVELKRELSRKRMNSFAGNLAVKMGGMHICHSELSKNSQLYIDEDGVHLILLVIKFF